MLHTALHLPPANLINFQDHLEPVELNPLYPGVDKAYEIEFKYYSALIKDLETANDRIYKQAQYLSLFYGTRPVFTRVEIGALRDEYLTNCGMIARANKKLDDLARALTISEREEPDPTLP